MTAHTIKIIWYDVDPIDENVYHHLTNSIFHYYNDQLKCVGYISSLLKSEIIFLISSPSSIVEILPEIHGLRQLDTVFIYSREHDYRIEKDFLDKYSKIIGIFDRLADLFQSIEENFDLAKKQSESFRFYEQHQKSTRDLSNESGSFLWLRLFKDMILKLPHDQQAKQEMIDKLKEFYRNNNHQLKLIEKFSQNYKSEDAISCYTGQPFLYKQLNRALRTEDIELLYKFRYFISDLSKNLFQEHLLLKQTLDGKLKFYRGVKLANDEAKKLKDNVGQLISTNGYFSTSFLKEIALAFADKSTENETSTLFDIECDLGCVDSVIMASIAHLSTNQTEEEVLFDLDAAFEILSVTRDLSSNILVVKMKATDEGATLAKEHIREHDRQLLGIHPVLLFGRLLGDIGQYEKLKEYFHRLEANPNGQDPASIHHYLGDGYFYEGNYERALKYYQDAYDMMINAKPSRDFASTFPLAQIGAIFSLKGDQDKALEYHIRAFEIRKIHLEHASLTRSMETIGLIYHRQGKYDQALKYLKSSLEIREAYLPSEHKDIARLLSNIASVYNAMDQLDTALEYNERSLKINKKCLPGGHNNIASDLSSIGSILSDQGRYDEALEYHQKALQIRENIFLNGHLNIASDLRYIGYIYYQKQNYSLSLSYFERALNIRDVSFPDVKDWTLVRILNHYGHVYVKLHEYEKALTYHLRALKVTEEIFPTGHSSITDCLTDIGIVYRHMNSYTKAFEYYKRAIQNEEQNCAETSWIRIARNYDSMGICLFKQDDEENGITYRLLAVRILDKVYPRLQHAKVVDSIGDICFVKEMYDDALECYCISLNIKLKYKKTKNDIDLAETLQNIGDVYFEKETEEHWKSNEQHQIKARFYYEKALTIYLTQKHEKAIHILNHIGSIYENISKYHLALQYYRQAIAIAEKDFPSDDAIKETSIDSIARVKWLLR
ncbi:hypothetical protein I4U23_023312 [Adineta vaga]|nr:hypothetical protein I4U23_023312 [Adineta vaga]